MQMNTSRFSVLAALSVGLILLPAAGSQANAAQEHSAAVKQQPRTTKASQTASALRDLWLGHVFWVRNVVLATFSKNESAATAAEQQVVANTQAIAAAFEPFYGAPAKDALFKLLAGHYAAIKAYLVATAAGDASSQSTATQSLTANAEEIAAFLSKANPNLSKDAVSGLLLAHGGHHIQQILDVKDAKYESEAKTWDEMKSHMYVIADALTDALVKQFARRF
jgi:hypothetical protein